VTDSPAPGERDAHADRGQLVLPVQQQDLEVGQVPGQARLVSLGRRVVLQELRPAHRMQLQHRLEQVRPLGQ
jgi:hypothetical protein